MKSGVMWRTLISFMVSAFFEPGGARLPSKWLRAISRAGKEGRETETMRERMKARKRRTVPGTKKARATMTVVGSRWRLTSRLERGRIYTAYLMGLRRSASGANVVA